HRFLEKFGADIIVHTQYGVSLLSEVLLGVTEKGTYSGINNKIQGLLQLYNGSHDDRWQVINLPEENLLVINIPDGVKSFQAAMHTITKGWTRFRDIPPANCFTRMGGQAYMGDPDGKVYKYLYQNQDDGTNEIEAEGLQAFNVFDR